MAEEDPKSPEKCDEEETNIHQGGNQKRKRTQSSSSDAGSTNTSGIPAWIAGASPPKFVSLEELMKTAVSLDKMALAHEIAVNENFKLSPQSPPPGSLHEKNLLSLLLPHHTRLKNEIEENLDLELLRQQCEHNCLDFLNVAGYILAVMGKLCAPIRDEKIAELRSCKELIPLFRMIPKHAATEKPALRPTSLDQEQNPDAACLPCTSSDSSATTRERRTSGTFSHQEILSLAYWELLEWCDNRAFPETLLVDQARLYDMRNRCLQLIITTSSVIIATNLAGQTIGDLPNFRNQVKDHLLILLEECEQRSLSDRLPNVAEQVGKEISDVIKERNLPEWDDKRKEVLRTQIVELSDASQPVRKLIRDRIGIFVRSVIHNPSASPIKLPPGLSLIQPELARLTGQFLRLVSHNRQVFAREYDEILQRVTREGAGGIIDGIFGEERNIEIEESGVSSPEYS